MPLAIKQRRFSAFHLLVLLVFLFHFKFIIEYFSLYQFIKFSINKSRILDELIAFSLTFLNALWLLVISQVAALGTAECRNAAGPAGLEMRPICPDEHCLLQARRLGTQCIDQVPFPLPCVVVPGRLQIGREQIGRKGRQHGMCQQH